MYIKTSIGKIKEQLEQNFKSSSDIEYQKFKNGNLEIYILYIKTICDNDQIHRHVFKPFFECENFSDYEHHLRSDPSTTLFQSEENTVASILRGNVAIFLPNKIFLFNADKVVNGTLSETTIETTLQGPKYSLSEDVATSINLIRHRYPSADLVVENTQVGTTSKTQIAILYDNAFVDKQVLEEIKKDLQEIEINVLQAAGQLHNMLTKRKKSLFPKMMITERPDRVTLNLAQGKVVVLMNGTHFALIAPAIFNDFLVAMDDLYQSYWVGRFLILIRYIGLFVAITVPAIYISITSFNPELLRVQLTISIAGSRSAVPYPSYLEVIFMLGMMELLTEASIRLPKSIGSTATTVGGLILGQAAQQAGLVSSIMIIVVAAVAIANFVIPINAMSFAIRVVKYFLILLATLFGIIGVVVGFYMIIVHLASMRSYGVPFLKIFTHERKVADANKGGD